MPPTVPGPRRHRLAVAAVMTAVSAISLAGGTLAQLTDSTSAPAQILTAGSVNVDLAPGADWNQNLSNLAVADTADRSVQVTNTSTLDIAKLTLTASVADTVGQFGGHLPEALTVDITATPTGGSPITVATGVRLNAFATGYTVTFPGGALPPGVATTLKFHYVVAGAPAAQTGSRTTGARETTANPDNKYQGSSASITYTVDAIQRAAVSDVPAAPTNAKATISGLTATVSFTPDPSNPAGTTYVVTSVEDKTISVSSASSPITISGLTDGQSYTFLLTAKSSQGMLSVPVTVTPTVTANAAWTRLTATTANGHVNGSYATTSDGIYALGNDGSATQTVWNERYSPASGKWAPIPNNTYPRDNAAAAADSQGRVYLIGGGSTTGNSPHKEVERYSPQAGWTVLTPLPSYATDSAAATDNQDRIYVMGGSNSSMPGAYPGSLAYRYDPTTNQWSGIASLPAPNQGGTAASDAQGRIYSIGGSTGGGYNTGTAAVYRYDPVANKWSAMASMPAARYRASATTDGQGHIYVIGGYSTSGASVNTVFRYDPATNTWKTIAAMNTPREAPVVGYDSTAHIYAFSGYNSASNSWLTSGERLG